MDANKPLIDHFPGEEVLFPLMGLYYDELFRYGIKFTADLEGTEMHSTNSLFIFGITVINLRRWII